MQVFLASSCNLSFIFDCLVISNTVNYIDQSENSSLHVFDFDTCRFSRLIADCSVEDINPDMTPYAIVDFSVSPKIKKKKSIKKNMTNI
jgi:hypothetical protein